VGDFALRNHPESTRLLSLYSFLETTLMCEYLCYAQSVAIQVWTGDCLTLSVEELDFSETLVVTYPPSLSNITGNCNHQHR
jgi:hypothetical protein